MRFYCLLSALTVLFMVGPAARADESPEAQIDFIRKLRAKGYADLALEHLEKLKKTAPASLAATLSLESARTRISAVRDKDPEQRQAQYSAARADLEAFVAKTMGEEAAQGRLELARLVGFQGQAILSKALRMDDTKAQQEVARKAEALFLQAGKELEAAAELLPEKERLQARFDRGINYLEQAKTYIDLGNEALNRKRAETILEARKIFEKIAEAEAADNPITMLASAWLVKCYQEGTEPLLARKYLNRVKDLTDKNAQPAQRWARLFYMQGMLKDPTAKLIDPSTAKPAKDDAGKLRAVQKEGESWLKDYPGSRVSPEGQAVRYELAQAYFTSAGQYKDPKSAAAVKLLGQAQKLLAELADSDSDYSERANQLNIDLSFMRMGEKTPVAQLKDFEECLLKAHYEMSQMRQVAAKLETAAAGEADKLKKQRKQHLNDVVAALKRGLLLADTKTSPAKLAEARYFLATAYFTGGDLYRAAVACEALARAQPPTKRSALAAGYALEAYAGLSKDAEDSTRERLRDLAGYILSPESQKLWQGDPVTPVAMYHLGMSYRQEDRAKEAIEALEKLPKEFGGYIYAQGQLVFTALEAREKAKSPEEKKYFQDKIRTALQNLPPLPADVDTSTAIMYFYAQLEQSKFLYADGVADLQKNDLPVASRKFMDMSKFNEQLQQQFGKFSAKMPPDTAEKLGFTLGVLNKYARLGLADIDYRNGNYDKVLGPALAGSVIDEVKKIGGKGDGPIRLKDYQITGEVLGLALRASVQKGKIDDAKSILKLMQRLTGEDGLAADPTATLRALVQELQIQVKELRKAGDSVRLKTMVANFSAFVDELAKRPDKKAMESKDYFFLANCYDSLGQHEKAAKLYGQIGPPAALDKKKADKLTEDEEKEIQTYWYVQVKYAEQLRLCAEQLRPDKEGKDDAIKKEKDDRLKEARKVIEKLIAHEQARQVILAEKEQNHLYEALELWGTATTKWQTFFNNPSLKAQVADDPRLKEMYFDAYYHLTYCTYKYSQSAKVITTKNEPIFLKKAANNIVRLETTIHPVTKTAPGEGWELVGHRFRELLAAEPKLKTEYDALKKTQ